MEAWVPVVVAASGLPAVAIAAWLARSASALQRALALRMALVGLAILCGALGLYWAAGDPGRTRLVALAMVVAVNALGISMFLRARREARGRGQR
jgi:hypothetical protein